MFYYAEGDTSHGPLPIEALRGRIGPTTLVWREGMAQWTPAADVSDLQVLLQSEVSPPAAPAVMQAPAVVSYATPNPAQVAPGLAIASMVVGIVSVVMLCAWPLSIPMAILAIIFGFIARSQCRREGRLGGGMALAGIILGFVPLLIVLIFLLLVVGSVILSSAGY